ncbi:hypothetical protein D9M71_688880 [compost metagenome]
MKLLRTHHQAGEVNVEHALEAFREKFLAVVEHRTLCLHQDIQLCERHADSLDHRCICYIDLSVMQPFKVRVGRVLVRR